MTSPTSAEIEHQVNCRRGFAALLSISIPLANYLVSLFSIIGSDKDRSYGLVALILPIMISGICAPAMRRIRASKARRSRVVFFEIASPLLAVTISGFLVFSTPKEYKWLGFIMSCDLIVWGWIIECSLGLKSQHGLTNSTTSIAAGYIHSLHVSPLIHWLLMIIPASIMIVLKVLAAYHLKSVFPEVKQEEEED